MSTEIISPDINNNDNGRAAAGKSWPSVQPLAHPLSFSFDEPQVKPFEYPCLMCEHVEYESRPILEHLFNSHKIVIGEVNHIANLSAYLGHWRKLMADKPLTTYTSMIQAQSDGPDAEPTSYYLLSDIVPEDQALRRNLQTERLAFVLDQQHHERSDPNFESICPMCPTEFRGDRSAVSSHLFEQHNFNVGLPDNLVNINEMLEILREKFDANQCLFCEKIFKSSIVMKQHMKKKKHMRLNPQNNIYDRFYLLNYLEAGKNWEQIKKEDEEDTTVEPVTNNIDILKQVETESKGQHVSNIHILTNQFNYFLIIFSSQWDDWTENDDDEQEDTVVCLFCPSQFDDSQVAFDHMTTTHKFDFHNIRKEWNIDYYESVKMINFIRRHQYEKTCCCCGTKFESDKLLEEHQKDEGHHKVDRQLDVWRDAQYLLPTYENDSLLRSFEDFDESEDLDYEQSEHKYRDELIDELKHEREEIMEKLASCNVQNLDLKPINTNRSVLPDGEFKVLYHLKNISYQSYNSNHMKAITHQIISKQIQNVRVGFGFAIAK
ncbi:C2H2-type zinc finger-containing protein [Heterostelium album PN500]|uniref:C2H2-type zinc finger-containing protein n=1 Tax=Heterostelium pallidum (strain ATCC 26659 / Pp 5 / PN500) TaxID=670386 RepID=D3BQI5_HETP5|nr:C2H2-type zinc finger-containing protein [Heterostelium album PN500]EFA76405.1 C2H2-type zinc finger-containing protein [Heterostelium album PN500]|eukprot:XP_020428537.1 C2H2-type zinc finger-containing protein [Heterostelium album PN500]